MASGPVAPLTTTVVSLLPTKNLIDKWDINTIQLYCIRINKIKNCKFKYNFKLYGKHHLKVFGMHLWQEVALASYQPTALTCAESINFFERSL